MATVSEFVSVPSGGVIFTAQFDCIIGIICTARSQNGTTTLLKVYVQGVSQGITNYDLGTTVSNIIMKTGDRITASLAFQGFITGVSA